MGLILDELVNVTYGHRFTISSDGQRVIKDGAVVLDAEGLSRFWTYVNKTDTCWLWTGAVTRDGYGQFSGPRRGEKQSKVYAHRLSYLLHHGAIPGGAVIRHRCDVPRCLNPQHLLIGSQADNIADAAVQGKYAHPRPGRWTIPAGVREAAIRATRRGELAELSRQTGYPLQHLAVIRLRARKEVA